MAPSCTLRHWLAVSSETERTQPSLKATGSCVHPIAASAAAT